MDPGDKWSGRRRHEHSTELLAPNMEEAKDLGIVCLVYPRIVFYVYIMRVLVFILDAFAGLRQGCPGLTYLLMSPLVYIVIEEWHTMWSAFLRRDQWRSLSKHGYHE